MTDQELREKLADQAGKTKDRNHNPEVFSPWSFRLGFEAARANPIDRLRSNPVESEEVGELVRLLKDSLPNDEVPDHAHESDIKALGDRVGYGVLMVVGARLWRNKLKAQGISGGEFTVGHCRATVERCLQNYEAKKGGR